MKIAVKISIDLKEGILPIFINELYKNSGEIKKLNLVEKLGVFSRFEIDIIYTDDVKFKGFISQIQKFQDKFANIEITNFLEEKIAKGILSVSGKLPVENPDEYEMNIAGYSILTNQYILSSDSPENFTGIKNSVGMISAVKKSNKLDKKSYCSYYSTLETDCVVLNLFSGLNGFPIIIEFDQYEDFYKQLISIKKNFSALRIVHFDDNTNEDNYLELFNNIDIPVVSKLYDEKTIFIMSGINYLINKYKVEINTLNVGFIGIDCSAVRLVDILLKMGVYKILGYDNDEKTMMLFEKHHGLATTTENIIGNCDVLILMKESFDESELLKLSPGVLVISLLNSPVENIISESKACKGIIKGSWFDYAILYPGIIQGMIKSGSNQLTISKINKVSEYIINSGSKDNFLPSAFGDIHDKLKNFTAIED